MRVFLDANVLFTAVHNPQGKAAFVIELANAGHYQLVTSAYAVEEASRNPAAKYPSCGPHLEELLRQITIASINPSAPCPAELPAKDAAIFLAAASCRATHLLTGDIKHFGPLMNRPEACFGIVVQTVAEFLASLRNP